MGARQRRACNTVRHRPKWSGLRRETTTPASRARPPCVSTSSRGRARTEIISLLIIRSLGNAMPSDRPDWSEPTLGFLVHDVARLLRKRLGAARPRRGYRADPCAVAGAGQHRPQRGHQPGRSGQHPDIEPITLVRLIDRLEAMGLSSGAWTRAIGGSATSSSPIRPGRSCARIRALGAEVREEALAGLDDPSRQRLLAALGGSRPTCRRSCAGGRRRAGRRPSM